MFLSVSYQHINLLQLYSINTVLRQMHCVGRCLKTDKSNKLTTVNFISAVFTSRKKSIVVASQRWVLSHPMCFSSFCTDKQSFSCLMQVAIIEVSCCQPFFQEHCLESHPAILSSKHKSIEMFEYNHINMT